MLPLASAVRTRPAWFKSGPKHSHSRSLCGLGAVLPRSCLSAARRYPWHSTGPHLVALKGTCTRSIYSEAARSYNGDTSEPGVDPRQTTATLRYGHIHQECKIEIRDYSSGRRALMRTSNQEFVKLMQDPVAGAREDWAKVRWINIGGMSWDVISALAIRHDLHPLALEDVIHTPRNGLPSKADYYPKHLFVRILCHSRARTKDHPHEPPLSVHSLSHSSASLASSTIPPAQGDHMKAWHEATTSALLASDKLHLTPDEDDDVTTPDIGRTASPEIIHGQRVNVTIEPMCIFLTRDGTLITINRDTDLTFTAPIATWLERRDTSLRTSADPSLLLHALLDLTVDRALEVVDEYHARILQLEHDTLLLPRMRVVRDLHILQGDLIQHKRTLEPIRKLLFGLMRYDDARYDALVPEEERRTNQLVKGFISRNGEIYLADVVDHMDYILSSLDMFANISENLVNYTFNMANHQMNETMRRLTLATIIFLPLTILTGYFGMNFDPMPSVQEHSDLYFWQIAVPMMVVVVVAFMYRDIGRQYRRMQRWMLSRRGRKPVVPTSRQYL